MTVDLALFAVTTADSAPEHRARLADTYNAHETGVDDYAIYLKDYTYHPSFRLAAQIDRDNDLEGEAHVLDWRRITRNYNYRLNLG